MNTIEKSDRLATVPSGVGDAVGVPERQWYVAVVTHNTEKNCAERLTKKGIENYVPIQSEYKVWKNGRKAKVDRVVIPSTIFIKCTEQERREIVKLPFINRFMTNKAGFSARSLHKPLAIIPDRQIDILKFMLGQSDIPIDVTHRPFLKGSKVRIIRGNLTGLEGEILELKKEKSQVIVSLDIFGCALLYIDSINLKIL